MTTPAIPEFLADYMERQRASRADAVNAVLGALTPMERHLIHDAAVMGYVRGLMHGKHAPGDGIPKDSLIVAEVIDACLAMPDLYPGINAVSVAPVPSPNAQDEAP